AHDRVDPAGEQERQRGRAVAQVRAGHLAGLDRVARAVEDVVRNLEGDAEQEAVLARPAAEQAGGLEQLPGLQRAALEVGVDGGVRVVPLAALQRLAAGEREAGVGEDADGGPCAVQAAARPRRTRAPSMRSSWTSVAWCTSSTATPAANGGGASSGAARYASAGRSRLPPAASASAPTEATTPGWLRIVAPSRSSTSSSQAVRPGTACTSSSVPATVLTPRSRCAGRRSCRRAGGRARRRSRPRAAGRRARPPWGSGARSPAGRC